MFGTVSASERQVLVDPAAASTVRCAFLGAKAIVHCMQDLLKQCYHQQQHQRPKLRHMLQSRCPQCLFRHPQALKVERPLCEIMRA